MCRAFSSCLQDAIDRGTISAKQAADVLGVSKSTVYRWLDDDGGPTLSQYFLISRHLSDAGDTGMPGLAHSPAMRLVPAGEARSNGVVDDEVTDAITALGRAAEAHRSGDGAAMDAALARLDDARARLTAERQRLST